MSIWILHLKLTPKEEEKIAERRYLPLPFDGLPDLSKVASQSECRKLLMELNPDAPPETLKHQLEQVWRAYSGLQEEDIIGVPLPGEKKVVIAEVTGNYEYISGEHTVPVKWHERRIPFSAFRKLQEILRPGSYPMIEVETPEARVIIRDRLPHAYNRFARWKWLLAIFLILQAVALAMRMISM